MERDRADSAPGTVNRAPARTPRPHAAGDVQGILWLQTVAGNAAVGELLAGVRAPASPDRDAVVPPPLRDEPPASGPPPARLTDLAQGDVPATGSHPHAADRAPARPPRPQPTGDVQGILRLQTVAGNAAVGELLAGARTAASPDRDAVVPPPQLRNEPPAEPLSASALTPASAPTPVAAPAPPQLTGLAQGDNPAVAELLTGLEADLAAQQAGALEHLTKEEAGLGEAGEAAVSRLLASHQAESAMLADRAAQARATVMAEHGQLAQRADASHAAHLASIDTWHEGQRQQITSRLGGVADEVRDRTAGASHQVHERTEAARAEASAHINQRRQDIRGLAGGGGGSTPRGRGHAEVSSRVKDQADRDLVSRSAGSLGQLRSGGAEAAGTLGEHGRNVASEVAGQAPELQAQVGDAASGARSAAGEARAQTLAALGTARERSVGSIGEVHAKARSALTARRDRAHADLVENAGRARQSVRDAVGGALAASGAHLRSALAPLARRRTGTAEAARLRSQLTAAVDDGGARLRQQVTDSATATGAALIAGGNEAATSMGALAEQANPMLGTVVDHHRSVGADVHSRVAEHQQQALQSLTSAGTATVGQALGGITQAAQQAAAQLEGQAGQVTGQIDAQAAQTRQAADQAVTAAPGRIAEGHGRIDARLPEKKPGGVLDAIGDWFKQQWDDLMEMVKDPGFWVGLIVAIVVTVVLAPVLGPFALVVAGAAAGAAAQMTHNSIAGRPLFQGVLKAAALGALGGAIFAVATVVIALAGLEGLAALAVLEVAAVITTLVTNAITGQRLTKGLLANMLLVGILHEVMKYFSGPIVEDPVVDPAPDIDIDPGPDIDVDPKADKDVDPIPDDEPYAACFLPGTPVLTLSGLQPIETVRAGDHVYGRPAAGGGAAAPSRVAAAFQGSARRVRRVRVDGGDLLVTRAHRFRLGSGRWKPARDLAEGDELETFEGTPVSVESVADMTWTAAVATHNLTVPEVSTYFVGVGRLAVLVHNGKGPPPPPNFDRPLIWIFGNKPKVRPTDTDGLSMWRTTSKADVDKMMEARVNGDGRPLDDPHAFYDEAQLTDAGIALPETPGRGTAVVETGLQHLSARPAGASTDPNVPLDSAQQGELQTQLDAVGKPVKVTPKQLRGTCG